MSKNINGVAGDWSDWGPECATRIWPTSLTQRWSRPSNSGEIGVEEKKSSFRSLLLYSFIFAPFMFKKLAKSYVLQQKND